MFDDLFTGGMTPDQSADLAKTLTVGHANGVAAPGNLAGGSALQMESVDGTLKSVTLSQRNLVMWPTLPQDRAYSLVEQYNRTNSYGDNGEAYIPESGSPAMNDSNYDRHAQKVVFFSTRRGVSLASQFVRMNGNVNAEALEAQSGTMWILEKLERALYKGQADFSSAGAFTGALGSIPQKLSNLALAGLEQQIMVGDSDATAQIASFNGYGGNQSVIRDVSDVIDETAIEDLATQLSENVGFPSVLDWSPRTMSDFVRQFFPKERVNALGTLDGRAGYVVRTLATTAGDIHMRPNVLLRPKLHPKTQSDRQNVPGAPATVGTPGQAAAGSKLKLNEQYSYTVASCNEQGEGAATTTLAAQTISADGNNLTFVIADPSAGPTPTHYAVYRTDKSGTGSPSFVGYVARTGANTTFTDLGNYQQGSAKAYMLDLRPEVIMWRQLAPMMKIQQGTLGTAREFLLWLAGTLIVFAPRFNGVFTNIVRSA